MGRSREAQGLPHGLTCCASRSRVKNGPFFCGFASMQGGSERGLQRCRSGPRPTPQTDRRFGVVKPVERMSAAGRLSIAVIVNSCHSAGLAAKVRCRARPRPHGPGHLRSSNRREIRPPNDRFQSTADVARHPLERAMLRSSRWRCRGPGQHCV